MIRALYSGVSGMRNHQTRMDVIGNNIANVNTTGFKYSRVTFSDQVSQQSIAASAPGDSASSRGGTNPRQVGLGMQTASIDVIHTQGNLQTTGKVTDLAIAGEGFFVVSDGPQRSYTRAGTFDFDSKGQLVVPSNGLHVMGWQAAKKLDSAGQPYYEVDHSTPISNLGIPAGAVIPPRPTTSITLKGNLDERTPITQPLPTDPPNYYDSSSEVFDSLGNQHFVTFRYTHTGPGSWDWSVLDSTNTGDPTLTATLNPPAPSITGPNTNTLQFGPDGLLFDKDPVSPGVYDGGNVTLQWALPSGEVVSTTVTPGFGGESAAQGMTQFGTDSDAVAVDQNGFTRGELTGVTVDKTGTINGIFSNGRQQLIGQVAMATFSNPGGLMKQGESNYVKTNNSGDPVIRAPGQAEAGEVQAGALEMSNVDLAEQFSDMIVTQRGFQANSRVITTSDEILQELINLKR